MEILPSYLTLVIGTSMFFTAEARKVQLYLRSAGCDDWCLLKTRYSSDNTDCLSSIQIDGTEMLSQSAGLNIAIINTKTGETVIKYITKLGGIFFSGSQARDDFKELINEINYDAIVAIVTLDMCYLSYSSWYSLLKDTKMKISESQWTPDSNLAIVVGCIGVCPKVSKSQIPYLYAGPERTYSSEIDIELNIVKITTTTSTPQTISKQNNQTNGVVSKDKSSGKSTTIIIIVIVVLLFLLLFIFLIFLFKTKYGRHLKSRCIGFCSKCRKRYSTSTSDGTREHNQRMFPNASYGKQSNVIMLTPKTKGHYENTDEDNNVYAALDQVETCQPNNRSQPNNYTYIDPKLDEARSQENLYYTATKDAMQQAKSEMMQRARSVTELTDLSLEESQENSALMKPRSNTDLSYLSVEPGTSHKIFKASHENLGQPAERSPTDKNFASYVQVAESRSLYKVPSNVTRHKPPVSSAPPVRNDDNHYVAMDGERTYDSCEPPLVYQDLDSKNPVDDNTYEALNVT